MITARLKHLRHQLATYEQDVIEEARDKTILPAEREFAIAQVKELKGEIARLEGLNEYGSEFYSYSNPHEQDVCAK